MRITKILLAFLVLMALFIPVKVAADDSQLFAACKQAPTSAICQDKGTKTNPVNHIIHVAADIVAALTGVAAVVFIILGGLTMVTSGGNTEAVANARKRIIYAVIGLVIVALAWTIITFLTDKLIKT